MPEETLVATTPVPEDESGEASSSDAATRSARRVRIALIVQGQGLLLMAVVIGVYFATASPYFFTWSNALTIGSASAALGIMAIAQTYLIVSGGLDVSVGSVVALTNVATAVMIGHSLSFWLAAPVAVLIGAGVGAVNALLVVVLGINPFISTLGTLSVFQGLAFAVTGGQTRVANDSTLSYIAINRPLGIPVPMLVMLVLFVLAIVVERTTGWGKTIYAIGGNAEASRLAGLRVRSTQATLYILSGAAGGLAGVLTTAQLASGSPQVGSTYLLSVVTAVILGGASLSGGRGSLIGTLIAVVILGMLSDGFSLLGWTSSAQQIALGAALIFAVLLDQTTRRLRGTASK
jgi:ribose transport system permease protein